MNREDDLKNLWAELRSINEGKEGLTEAKDEEDPTPKESVELDSLLSRLEDIVSRLEDALGKKDQDKDKDEEDGEEPKKESYVPRRVRRSLRNRD